MPTAFQAKDLSLCLLQYDCFLHSYAVLFIKTASNCVFSNKFYSGSNLLCFICVTIRII